ncbi:ABC transporter permease [Spirochaetia bacterium]|nr:ABC transporter permease [Spirochaetia bacterium]
MIWLMVLRNLLRNVKNSAVILFLIALISFLFFIGNSVLGRADQGLREAYVDSLTADVVIQKSGDFTLNLFGANTPVIDDYFTIPSLPAYDVIMDIIAPEPALEGITSQVSSNAYMDVLELREPALLCGVDAESYFSLFPGIILEEGRFLKRGEYGAMISADRADRIEAETGQRPAIGTPLLFTSGGDAGFKIREVPLTGIYHYRNPGQFMNEIVIIDPQTARVLSSIQVASSDVEVGQEAVSLLTTDVNDLFGEASFGETAGGEEFSADALESFLTGAETAAAEPANGGDWNFILLRLKKGVPAAAFIASLNKKLAPYGVSAVGWRTAAGISAIMLLLIQALFNAGIILVSVAGIMVVVNILLISVFRRTREIGTLRAIGASDGYIRSLILGENCVLAGLAGIIGVLGGLVLVKALSNMEILIPNDLIASLLGGKVLALEFLPGVAVTSLAVALILGIAASLYPVETAVRIDPIVAVQQG